ncbi:MAG: hypothetical protein MHM6MM_008695, partial [Cercozoa sp. M6MM]
MNYRYWKLLWVLALLASVVLVGGKEGEEGEEGEEYGDEEEEEQPHQHVRHGAVKFNDNFLAIQLMSTPAFGGKKKQFSDMKVA